MGKIFAGLLFVFLHFRINGFDLLPDFVGYLLSGVLLQGVEGLRGMAGRTTYIPVKKERLT
ncbi:MAG: hypothetical protein E7445_08180 [Ruminococcaceae bacterium]|nr:hypothetical protein [Oscillospiraceae bacterium]